MTLLKFRNIKFIPKNEKIKVLFMEHFYFYTSSDELKKISDFKIISDNSIEFQKAKNSEKRFFFFLNQKFRELKSVISNKECIYIHSNSGIPLIGSSEFGIVDRATNMIEIKPITLCNIDCIYCSVDQNKRRADYVVEEEYLIDELNKVIKIKKNKVNIHIGGQGEPTLYSDLEKLATDLRSKREVNHISIATNAVLLSKKKADSLIRSGITHFHISLNAFSKEKCDFISCRNYPIEQVKSICKHIAKNAKLVIAPVYIPSVNDSEIEELILFSKKINSPIMIQNFLEYRFGKRPVNSIPMKLFFQKLSLLEKKYDVNLTALSEPKIIADEKLPKPFHKGDVIDVIIVGNARIPNAKLGVCKDRSVIIADCFRDNGKIRARIIRDKDNIFVGVPA
ncbi:MAG: radical SAM protein [archaeon]